MGTPARRAALRLLSSGLSSRGFAAASLIMSLEAVLLERSGWTEEEEYDPQGYYLAIHGTPGERIRWGWRFEGHHLSVHYTLHDGRILSPTPTFFGAAPSDTRASATGFVRPLAGVEDAGRELVRELGEEERRAAILAASAPPDLVTANRPRVVEGSLPVPFSWMDRSDDPEALRQGERWLREKGLSNGEIEALRYRSSEPRGLPGRRMRAGPLGLLRALIREYVDRLPDEVAEAEEEKLRRGGLADVYFAWAGGVEKGQPHYYRVQGPWFLLEYDNTQDGANHIHSVWRDLANDFGADLLTAHYAESHG